MATRRFPSGVGRTTTTAGLLALAAVAAGPATAPSTSQPSGLLAEVDAAYAGLTSAEFDGRISAHLDVGGKVNDHSATFTSAFAGPTKFRHEVPGDVTVVSTGSHVYASLTTKDEYVSGDAPKGRAASQDWPAGVGEVLANQNPSLLFALVPSVRTELARAGKPPVDLPATLIDGVACPTVRVDSADGKQSDVLVFDPATHLLRRDVTDLAEGLKKQGTADVRSATVTVEYTAVRTGSPIAADRFAYAPPAAAVVATAGPVADGDAAAGDEPGSAATALVGKPAPAFTLDNLDGTKVTLADLKGKVVVLDMWATWCGPCVASLPHLDQLYKDLKAKDADVAIFAVNQQEPAEKVGPFVKRKKWSLPVLLDLKGDVGKAYKADAIPETVVIGKDGVIAKVFVGSGNEDGIKVAVEKALK